MGKNICRVISLSLSLGFMGTMSVGESAALPQADMLDKVVITATRTPVTKTKISQQVETITKEKIKALGATDVSDALKQATNLDLSKHGMIGSAVQLRGMNTAHTLILLDGRRVAGEDNITTANAYELDRINIDTVDRIEIVRGPGSAIYGSDALGGVINIITAKSAEPKTTVGTEISSRANTAYFAYGSGQQGKFNFRLAGRLAKVRANYDDNRAWSNLYGPRRFLDFSGTYSFDPNHDLTLDMNFMKEQLQQDYQDDPTSMPPLAGQREWFNNVRSNYALTYHGKDSRHDYKVRTYYSLLQKHSYQKNQGKWQDFDRTNYSMWVVDAQDAWQMDDKHRFTYGTEYKHNFVKGTRLGDGGEAGYTVSESDITKDASEKALHDYSGFLQDEWQITPKLYIVPALRYGWHSSFGSHVDPKLGVTYEFSPSSRLKANVGRGYKAPGISELYETMTRNMGGMRINVLNNPELQPEVATSYDISLEGEKNNNWGKITYFANKVSDLINYKITSTGHMQGDLRYYNIDKADINGVELEVGRKFTPQWQVKAVYNYLDARDSATNQRLGNRANQTAQLELIYRDKEVDPLTVTLWNQWNLGYHYEWTSLGRRGMVNNYQDFTFSTLNLAVHKKWGKYSAWVGLDNIFDKKFNPTEDVPFTIEGRTWRVGAEISF